MDENYVTWDESYSVGFEPIDNQHKKLVEIINTLYDGCKLEKVINTFTFSSDCKRGDVAADIAYLYAINSASEYARTHFMDEEKYMRHAGYPELKKHKKQHKEFVDEIKKSVKLFEEGRTTPIEMANYLKNWLLNHIAISDKQYAPYLAKLN
jgi:hemerythrin